MTATKKQIRRQAREALASMSADDRRDAAVAIQEKIWTIPAVAEARTLLLYASTGEEVGTDRIAEEARARGIITVFPRCLDVGAEMTLHPVEQDSDLVAGGRFGLREPAESCPEVAIGEIDAAVLPGLAFDRAGNRLGRGAGFYDRLLGNSEWRAFTCGLFFAQQEAPTVPTDPWDRPMDSVVTQHELLLLR